MTIQKLVRGGALAAIALMGILPVTSEAAIIQDQSSGVIAWQFGGAVIGQSFTADASVVQLSSIEIYYWNTNTAQPAATPIIELLAGDGYGGPVLDTFQFLLAENEPSGYKAADFSGNILTAGLVYTFRLTQADPAEGGVAGSPLNPYAGGTLYSSGGVSLGNDDLRFRINGVGDGAAVPEPATGALMGLAMAVVLVRRWLNQRGCGDPR
jgi:hypothetical protein